MGVPVKPELLDAAELLLEYAVDRGEGATVVVPIERQFVQSRNDE